MKVYLILQLFLFSSYGFSQEPEDLQALSHLLEAEIPDSLNLRRREQTQFMLSAEGLPVFDFAQTWTSHIHPLLSKNNSLFSKDKRYTIYLFVDPLTSRRMMSIRERSKEKGRFGPLMVNAEVHRGFIAFKDSLLKDWASVIGDINLIDSVKQVDVFVHKSGKAEFKGDELLVQSLSSARKPSWKPAIYYGKPVNNVLTIKVQPGISLNRGSVQNTELAFFVSKCFEEKILKFDPDWSGVLAGKKRVAVSFVYDSFDGQLSRAAVHCDKYEEADRLVDWISANDVEIGEDFLKNDIGSSRYLFYLD